MHRTIELNGKEYILKYDFNAICLLEDKTGKSIATLFESENMGISTIRALFYAGIKHSNKGITIDKAGEILGDYLSNDGDLTKLVEGITEAITESGVFGKNLKAGAE